MINNFVRYQKSLAINDLYPKLESGKCSCGCGQNLVGLQKKWASKDCKSKALLQFYITKGDMSVIREVLFKLDEGYCRSCGVYDEKWEADHILPVFKGGAGLGIENYQTLCPHCHKIKTNLDRIPNSSNIHTTCFNISHPVFERFWTFNKKIFEDIVRY